MATISATTIQKRFVIPQANFVYLQARRFHKYSPDTEVKHLVVTVAVFTAANTAAKDVKSSPPHIHVTVPNQNQYIRNSGSYFRRCRTRKTQLY